MPISRLSSTYLQMSSHADFIDTSSWNEQILYFKERDRGYEHTEDLYNPGYFECPIEVGTLHISRAR